MSKRLTQFASLGEIADADTNDFVKLILLSGLDPSQHLRFANWSNIDFSQCDLRGYDFTGARLYGCKFNGALINGASFDHAEMDSSALRAAKDWDAYNENYLRERHVGRTTKADDGLIPDWLSTTRNERYPVLTLRDIVVFPYMIVPYFVGREKSINALDEVMRTDRQILLATQKNAGDDDPEPSAFYTMGTLATVLQLLKLPDGTVKVLVEGTARVKVERFSPNELFLEAEVERVDETIGNQDEIEAFARLAVSQFESYVKLNKKISPEVLSTLSQIDDYSKLADTIASHLAINISKKQKILELLSVSERLERVFTLMENEISVLQVERKIRSRVRSRIKKTQRKYLNEQMKAIQKALVKASDERESFFLHEQMTAVQKELEDFDKGKSRRRVKR